MAIDLLRLPPPLRDLVSIARLAPLDDGQGGDRKLPAQVAALRDTDLFGSRPVVDPQMAAGCRAALWLYCDQLDASHRISQEIDTPTGSFWHGIMHRREGDFDNAKYWFRRVGRHPVFVPLADAAGQLAAAQAALPPLARFLTPAADWNPHAFVDLCRDQLSPASPCHALCRQIQQCEWELLFDHCHRRALGDD